MAVIRFYTKIGCLTSLKQIALLEAAGHEVQVCDLIAEPWTAAELLDYFGDMPVAACFNPNATRVKSGEIDPEAYGAEEALALMLEDHLLIRRPLMESGEQRMCGFDPGAVHAWVGLAKQGDAFVFRGDLTSCSHPGVAGPSACP